ncbi:MAG TPA: trigger factor [bacterium]|nr:trigger factor [bacterium]
MDVKIEKLGPVQTKLTLTIEAETVKKEMDKVFRQIRREAAVPGFRPGKAPMSMLQRKYGDYAEDEVKNNLVGPELAKAIDENHLRIAGSPEVEKNEIGEDGVLTVVAVFETHPEVELNEYKGLEITREKAQVLPAAVDGRLSGLRESTATVVDVTDHDAAQDGDLAKIDFEGKIDGEPFEGGAAQGHVLTLGAKQFIPGFEEGVIGMKVGETKDVALTMPADYWEKKLAGKDVVFTVTLHALQTKELPELDDEFAKDTGEAETLDELKQKIHDQILKQEEARTERQARKELIKKLVERHPIEVPPSIVKDQIEYSIQRMKMQMQMFGMPMPDDPAADDRMRERFADESKQEVQASFILAAIAKAENIELTEEDVELELQHIADEQQRPVAEISAYYQKQNLMGGLRERLMEEKVTDFLFAAAKVTWEDPLEKKAAAAEENDAEVVKAEEESDEAENKDE